MSNKNCVDALRTVAEFPITDPSNMDAMNMRKIAVDALESCSSQSMAKISTDALTEADRLLLARVNDCTKPIDAADRNGILNLIDRLAASPVEQPAAAPIDTPTDREFALSAAICVHPKGVYGDEGGSMCCPITHTRDASFAPSPAAERAAFEAWRDKRAFNMPSYGGLAEAYAWDAWQARAASANETGAEAAAIPAGWKLVRVNEHFDALIAALDRAESKGYLPDSIREEWENFACDENVTQPAAAPKFNKQKMLASAREHGMDLGDNPVAYEFYNKATGHAVVDYTRWTHRGHLTEKDGYEARPLAYANAEMAQPAAAPIDPTDPGYDVETLREHIRHLERRVRQLSAPSPADERKIVAQLLFALTERQKGNVIRSEDEYIDSARALLAAHPDQPEPADCGETLPGEYTNADDLIASLREPEPRAEVTDEQIADIFELVTGYSIENGRFALNEADILGFARELLEAARAGDAS